MSGGGLFNILILFGTRPELIKLAPVVRALEARPSQFETVNLSSGQHGELLRPLLRRLNIRIDYDLQVMREGQGPSQVAARVIHGMERVLASEKRIDLLLVQGDTTTALAGALAGFHRGVRVGHIEAGLRSGDVASPFPEEMNRRLITQLASYHFAATARNVETLRAEGVDPMRIALTGNPVIDALLEVIAHATPSAALARVLDREQGRRLLVLTTHRRESFGGRMASFLRVLAEFVAVRPDVALVFPVHPNPAVRDAAESILGRAARIHLVPPLDHADFVYLLSRAWLVVSDSGGVQEEVATLGKPLLVLRDTTERPEVIDAGIGRLVGSSAARFRDMLDAAEADDAWVRRVHSIPNPFGDGRAAPRIVDAIQGWLSSERGDA